MDDTTRFEEFFRDRCYNELMKAVSEDKSVVIDFSIIDRFDPILADQLLEDPENILESMEKAAYNTVSAKVRVRVNNLPESRSIRIRDLRAKHLGKLWTIDTIIKSATEVKPQIYEVEFECPRCGTHINYEQESNLVQKPVACDCGNRGDFKLVEKKMMDTRWLNGMEPFDLTMGEKPGEVSIFLKEDLTTPRLQKKSDPGARLKFTGILRELPKRIKGKLSTKMDIYLDAVHFETNELDFEELEITKEDEQQILELANDPNIYEKLRLSIAPGIFGFDEIKEAVCLQLFGGIQHKLPDGTHIRGNIHILLTGDPGVGKSVLLKLVSSVVPRGKYVSGSGVSGAGLTATVRKDENLGTWVLEAGALILCNKGMIAIDEFDKMSKDDQIAMHEATSVETVSVAKASIIATLPAQTAVLAGANPKYGRFDPFRPIGEQIMIPDTLLSRFDLKFALRDRPSPENDASLAEHIIMSRTKPELIEPLIDRNLLRKYIAYAKQTKDLELPLDVAEKLKDYYVKMRNSNYSEEINTISITLRQYEALLRLAEASAKIRLSKKMEMSDADRALRLMEYSLRQLGFDSDSGQIDIDKLEGGMPSSKRRKITNVIEMIEKLQKEMKEIPFDTLKAQCESIGVKDFDNIIEQLKREGSVFEPKPGFIRKT